MFGTGLPAPTVAQQLRMDLIVEACCIACIACGFREPCEVHHLTVGGKHGQPRRGHAYTIGLCPWHHRGAVSLAVYDRLGVHTRGRLVDLIGPSYALQPFVFRGSFGDDDKLLAVQSVELARVASTYVVPRRGYADPVLPGGIAA